MQVTLLPYVTFHQTHSGFLNMKLTCYALVQSGTEPPYDQLEQLGTELLKAHTNLFTKTFITDYAVNQYINTNIKLVQELTLI